MIYGTNTFVFHQTPVKGTWRGLKCRNEANLTCMLKCSPMVVKVGTQKQQDKRIVMTNCKSFACGYFFDDDEFRKKVRKFSVKSVPNLRVFFERGVSQLFLSFLPIVASNWFVTGQNTKTNKTDTKSIKSIRCRSRKRSKIERSN